MALTTRNIKDADGVTFEQRVYDETGGDVGPFLPMPGDSYARFHVPAAVSFTRPADTTAYAIGDLVANSTVAGSVVPLSWTGVTLSGNGGKGMIASIIIAKSGSTTADFRVHYFLTAPGVTNGDNGAILVSAFSMDDYLGSVNVSTASSLNGGTIGVQAAERYYQLASGDTLYALLESRTAFTPTSGGVYTVKTIFHRYA